MKEIQNRESGNEFIKSNIQLTEGQIIQIVLYLLNRRQWNNCYWYSGANKLSLTPPGCYFNPCFSDENKPQWFSSCLVV